MLQIYHCVQLKCCSVVFGVTLRLLVINISSSCAINKLRRLLPAMCHNFRDTTSVNDAHNASLVTDFFSMSCTKMSDTCKLLYKFFHTIIKCCLSGLVFSAISACGLNWNMQFQTKTCKVLQYFAAWSDYWPYEKSCSIRTARFHCNVCIAALWLARLSVTYIFIHQNGSKQKENAKTQTKSSIKNTNHRLCTFTEHYNIHKMYWPNFRIY